MELDNFGHEWWCVCCKISMHLMHNAADDVNGKGIMSPEYSLLDTVQDFLIVLDMKPCMDLVEISIFSLDHVIVRLTKIMNNLFEHLSKSFFNFKN